MGTKGRWILITNPLPERWSHFLAYMYFLVDFWFQKNPNLTIVWLKAINGFLMNEKFTIDPEKIVFAQCCLQLGQVSIDNHLPASEIPYKHNFMFGKKIGNFC